MHGVTHLLNAQRHQGIEIIIKRVTEGRHENHGTGGPGLVVIVDDLRKPLDEQLPVHVSGFGHV